MEEEQEIQSELNCLIRETFYDSVNKFTLTFKDQEMEEEYYNAKVNLHFLSSSSRRFLYAIFFGFIGLVILDCVSASGFNPDYGFPLRVWAVESLLLLLPPIELLCFFWRKASLFRGVALTFLGGAVLVHNTLYFSIISNYIRPTLGPK